MCPNPEQQPEPQSLPVMGPTGVVKQKAVSPSCFTLSSVKTGFDKASSFKVNTTPNHRKAKAKLVSSRPMMLLPVNVNYIFRRGHNWIWNLIRILHLRLCFQLQHSFGQSFLLNYFQWWAGPGLTWEYCKNDDKLRIMCFITLSPIGLSANSDFLQDPKMRNIRNNDTSK